MRRAGIMHWAMVRTSAKTSGWLTHVLESVRISGCAVVEDVVPAALCQEIRHAMYETRERIARDVGMDRLERAGEVGVLRLMVAYDEVFLRLLEIPEVLAVVDETVSETAVLHLQNGLILPSFPDGDVPEVFQTSFHRDFPRYLNGFLASINCFIAVDEFSAENGGTLLVPGTHQRAEMPSSEFLVANAVPVECAPGAMVVFDSTLWHAAGANVSGHDRVAVNQQFTRSWIKQQVDYVRALGSDVVVRQPARTQQLLGWYTRVVTSLDEFYRPTEERLYRAGQG